MEKQKQQQPQGPSANGRPQDDTDWAERRVSFNQATTEKQKQRQQQPQGPSANGRPQDDTDWAERPAKRLTQVQLKSGGRFMLHILNLSFGSTHPHENISVHSGMFFSRRNESFAKREDVRRDVVEERLERAFQSIRGQSSDSSAAGSSLETKPAAEGLRSTKSPSSKLSGFFPAVQSCRASY